MRSFVVRKRHTQPRVRVYLEELEGGPFSRWGTRLFPIWPTASTGPATWLKPIFLSRRQTR